MPRVAIPTTFTGLAWSHDGGRLFVSGGFDDVVYGFDHAAGLLSRKVVLRYPEREKKLGSRVPAGLAPSRDGKTLWVANAFGHSLARFDVSGELRAEIAMVQPSAFPDFGSPRSSPGSARVM